MFKKSILGISILTTMAISFNSCSSDDDDRDCDSCDLQGQTIEICDNGNDTYTVTAAGQSETITQEDLEGLTPEEYIDLICSFEDLIP